MRLILLGAPGSGKGTQAEKLADRLNILHLSTGAILRGAIQEGTQVGLEARAYVEKGALVPNEIIDQLVSDRLQHDDCKWGYILDGYPRTMAQAEYLDGFLKKRGESLTSSIYIRVSEEEVIRRISGRLQCSQCGTGYHSEFQSPKISGRCDKCDGELKQRKDDTPETVIKRLKIYNNETAPLLAYYQKSGRLVKVDGMGDVEVVFDRICSLIDKWAR